VSAPSRHVLAILTRDPWFACLECHVGATVLPFCHLHKSWIMRSVHSVIRAVSKDADRDLEPLHSTIKDGLLGSADNQADNVLYACVVAIVQA
jgi:hypothetical protein